MQPQTSQVKDVYHMAADRMLEVVPRDQGSALFQVHDALSKWMTADITEALQYYPRYIAGHRGRSEVCRIDPRDKDGVHVTVVALADGFNVMTVDPRRKGKEVVEEVILSLETSPAAIMAGILARFDKQADIQRFMVR